MRREGWGEKETQKEEEYRAPARDRLQHAGFDHMAPPGAENTEPCDYPKHTGSAWVSEPGGQFPTLQLWTVWAVFLLGHSAESRLNLFPLKQDEPPLMPSEHDSTSFLCHRYQNKIKKQFKACWQASPGQDIQFNQQGTWKIVSAVLQSNLDFLRRLEAQTRETSLLFCWEKKTFGISCPASGNLNCFTLFSPKEVLPAEAD